MNLTNPPLTRGLGKTGLLNRRGLLTGEPTPKGLAGTGTRRVRDQETGRPTPVGELVSAKTVATAGIRADAVTSIWTNSSDTLTSAAPFAAINVTRLADTELVIIITWVSEVVPTPSASDDVIRRIVFKRDSTELDYAQTLMHLLDPDVFGDQSSTGIVAAQCFDDDNVEGPFTYNFFHYYGTSGTTSVGIEGWRITMLERKR